MSTVRRTLGPDPRNKSNVEVEKGETILTNTSRGLNNIVEFYKASGEKHSQGGTPMNLPTNDDGPGASFVFSDKLKIKDPVVLELFGYKGKKSATPAEISGKHLKIINSSKEVLLDPDADKLSKMSAQLNIETSKSELDKLKIIQESMKGFPNGLPSGTETFFQKMGIDPASLVAPSDEMGEIAQNAEQKALGGIVRKRDMFYMADGGSTKSDNPIDAQFGDKDPNAKVQYYYIRDVLGKNEGFKKALFEEYKKISKNPEYYGKGYGAQLNNPNAFSQFEIKTPQEAYDAYLKMQERNLIFKSQGYNVAQTPNDPSKNTQVREWSGKHGVPLPNMDGIAKEQIAYRAFENLSSNRDAYSEDLKEVLQPFSATQFGSNDDKFRGQPSTVTLSDGAYTNTSAGQISNFAPPPSTAITPEGKLTFNPKADAAAVDQGEYDPANPNKRMLDQPLGFRSQDIRNLNRAVESRAGIRRYDPFAISPDLKTMDVAYYSPERAIAAIQESVNSAEDVSKSFGDAQGASASALALSGKAFDATANVISDYADKNVGVFNSMSAANTEIQNKQNLIDAETKTQLYADNVDMDEKFRRGVEMAKDKIAMMRNAAETNMAQTYNANLLTEQYKKDPYSGLVYFTNGKDLEPSTEGTQQSQAQELQDFIKSVPQLDPNVAAKVFLGMKTGKYTLEPTDGFVTPNELKNP